MVKKFSFLIFLFSLFFTSCEKSSNKNDSRLYLDKNWYYSVNGLYGKYEEINLEEFPKLANKFSKRQGYIWLKNKFIIPENLQEQSLACYLGVIKIADQAYINNTYIGRSGFFPPNEFTSGETASAYTIPSILLDYENELTLLIWCNGFGSIDSIPFISTENDVTVTKIANDYSKSKIYLLLSAILLIISFIYILLFIFRPQEKENFSFSCLTFFSAFFLAVVSVGEYSVSFQGKYSFLVFEKMFLGIVAVLTANSTVSFLRDYLDVKDTLKVTIFRYVINIVSILIILPAKSVSEFLILLIFSYSLMGIHLLYAVYFILKSFKERNKHVKALLSCFIPTWISIFISLYIYFVLHDSFSILTIVIGWQFTILLFLSNLVYTFASTQNKFEYLNKNLEKLVNDRTNELTLSKNKLEDINIKLNREKKRAETEIELASFVQQNFYKHEIPDFNDWEITFYSKAFAGVSGDLYDFFYSENKLNGLGIFDVSGHGISSGLVTMLVKNIIQLEFTKGFSTPLHEVVSVINNRVIQEKGNIENYLTGILVRIKNSNTIEFVNAGHPQPFMYRISDNSFDSVDNINSKRYGVIGIQGFEPNFETTELSFEKGDELLLFTDGITEATNSQKIPYGKNNLINSFKRNIFRPFDKQINFMLNDLLSFLGQKTLDDDVTFIILRKK